MPDTFDDDEVAEIVDANPDLQKLSRAEQRKQIEKARKEQEKKLRGRRRG